MTAPWGEAVTAISICTDAALELGAIGEGEELSDSQPKDMLRRLNALLDSESLDRSKVFRYQIDSGALVAGKSEYTVGSVGSGADFAVSGGRPQRVWWAYVRDANGMDVPVTVLPDRQAFDSIPLKTVTSAPRPQALFYDATYPQGKIILYPVPSASYTLFWVFDNPFLYFPNLTTAFALPNGFYRWLVLNLAVECSGYFQVEPTATLLRRLSDARANLANVNRVDPRIGNDASTGGGWYYNVYTDRGGGER
ncbi:MAG: hypothetical protein OEV94_12060 [Deltaproteobacteria bacterium]|nr:hypothetical protein [Deltaproteobacteria bacterium]